MIDPEYVKQLESRLELLEKDREDIIEELIAAYDASDKDNILLMAFEVLAHSNKDTCLEICDVVEEALQDLKNMSGIDIQAELTELLTSYPDLIRSLMVIATHQRNILEICRKTREYVLSINK